MCPLSLPRFPRDFGPKCPLGGLFRGKSGGKSPRGGGPAPPGRDPPGPGTPPRGSGPPRIRGPPPGSGTQTQTARTEILRFLDGRVFSQDPPRSGGSGPPGPKSRFCPDARPLFFSRYVNYDFYEIHISVTRKVIYRKFPIFNRADGLYHATGTTDSCAAVYYQQVFTQRLKAIV